MADRVRLSRVHVEHAILRKVIVDGVFLADVALGALATVCFVVTREGWRAAIFELNDSTTLMRSESWSCRASISGRVGSCEEIAPSEDTSGSTA